MLYLYSFLYLLVNILVIVSFVASSRCFFYSLTGNKGLCGVPSLPDCPLFWENGGLSTGGKIAIGLSCLVVLCVLLLIYMFCIRRGRNDYDFGLPQDLMCKFGCVKVQISHCLVYLRLGFNSITYTWNCELGFDLWSRTLKF